MIQGACPSKYEKVRKPVRLPGETGVSAVRGNFKYCGAPKQKKQGESQDSRENNDMYEALLRWIFVGWIEALLC